MVRNQTNANRNGETHPRADPPTVLLNNCSMVHNQANTNENGNNHLMCRPPTVLLKNGSMVHNQTNADRLRKLSVTFLENVWLAQMTLKAKMERNRSAHHVPNAVRVKVHDIIVTF